MKSFVVVIGVLFALQAGAIEIGGKEGEGGEGGAPLALRALSPKKRLAASKIAGDVVQAKRNTAIVEDPGGDGGSGACSSGVVRRVDEPVVFNPQ